MPPQIQQGLVVQLQLKHAQCSVHGLCDLFAHARSIPIIGRQNQLQCARSRSTTHLAQARRTRGPLWLYPRVHTFVHYINVLFSSSDCAVRGFVRTHFLPFTRSDRESRTTLHLLNLWTKLHGFNPYFLHFLSTFPFIEPKPLSAVQPFVYFCHFYRSCYIFLKLCFE
jgi:hypothetical protein